MRVYHNDKYFLRQFEKTIGYTQNQYRLLNNITDAVVNPVTVTVIFLNSSNRKRWDANRSKWVQKKTLTPEKQDLNLFSR